MTHTYRKGTWGIAAVAAMMAAPLYAGQFNTTITVGALDDPDTTRTGTCDGRPLAECTFRRALNQAARLAPGDRPVLINFDLPTGAENSGGAAGTWTITLTSGQEIDPFANGGSITTSSITEPDADITIDGSTQPGGRANGPVVFINHNEPLTGNRRGIVIRRMGFYGGVGLTFSRVTTQIEDTEPLIDGIWWGLSEDGQDIMFVDQNMDLAGDIGVAFEDTDGATIINSVITGAQNGAIRISSGANDATVDNNYIGTRGDGTVPQNLQLQDCQGSLTFFPPPLKWYGGLGIVAFTSDNATITNNVLAGLENVRAPFDTAPTAIEIASMENTLVQNNVIGIDAADFQIGVCGAAVFESNTLTAPANAQNQILNNIVANSRPFQPETEGADSVFFLSGDRTVGTTIKDNLVFMDASLEDERGENRGAINFGLASNIIGFASSIRDSWEFFNSARVLEIDGVNVIGTYGDYSPCANCEVEIWLDDLDDLQEAQELLLRITTDSNGDWQATLPAPLQEGESIRTMTTSTTFFEIPEMSDQTTGQASRMYPFDFLFESNLESNGG